MIADVVLLAPFTEPKVNSKAIFGMRASSIDIDGTGVADPQMICAERNDIDV